MRYQISFIRPKEHHPVLPKHPGKQLKDWPPQQIVRHCGSCIIAPITSGSCSNPPFHWGTTRHRKWAQRATPPLLCHRVDESLLTYTAASHPHVCGVPFIQGVRKISGKNESVGQATISIQNHIGTWVSKRHLEEAVGI
ncbi:hypothetical protein AVEN_157328-1 [Araneus ventricosus]|uniref:Uncharacterized protein n=1 Tax=Araneus ventricosus TaxID=182803 RepID=A0A4Y2SG60_ARAVE|nr:hypothetical protein AVEN_157328-1 [Araneus ventricosus]